MGRVAHWAFSALLGTSVAAYATRRQSLSSSGGIAASAVGTLIYGAGGAPYSALLLLFFASSSVLSRLSGGEKPRREAIQVLANGGIPAFLTLLHKWHPSQALAAAYGGAVAAATSDTWSTEIGRLSPVGPRLITTGRTVQAGVSGGVTPLGMAGAVGGATVIGLSWARLYPSQRSWHIITAGIAGSLVDSLLGASLQGVYICQICGQRTEDAHHTHDAVPSALSRAAGIRMMTNDTVNASACLAGAMVAAVLMLRPGK